MLGHQVLFLGMLLSIFLTPISALRFLGLFFLVILVLHLEKIWLFLNTFAAMYPQGVSKKAIR